MLINNFVLATENQSDIQFLNLIVYWRQRHFMLVPTKHNSFQAPYNTLFTLWYVKLHSASLLISAISKNVAMSFFSSVYCWSQCKTNY